MPEWALQTSYGTTLAIVSIVLICALATLWAANGTLKATPAETMRGIDKRTKERKAKTGRAKPSGNYVIKWVWRDIGRNKLRYLIGVVGVTGSMMLMIAGFGMFDSINSSNDYVFTKQYSYDYMGQISVYTPRLKAAVDDAAGADRIQWLKQNSADLEYVNGDGETSAVISIIEDGPYYCFENDADGRAIALPDEGLVLTAKIARQIGAKTGDRLRFSVTGIAGSFEAEVKYIAAVRTPQGIYLSDKAWEKLGEEFMPATAVMDTEAYESLKETDYFSELTSKRVQEDNIHELSDSANTVIKLLVIASFLLSVVILYNLGIMNYEERYREYATMKVIGYTKAETTKIVLTDCMFTTIPGWLIGIPAGFGFLKLFIHVVSFDSYEWRMSMLPWHFILVSVFVMACAVLVHLVICRKVNRIVMTEALKSVD